MGHLTTKRPMQNNSRLKIKTKDWIKRAKEIHENTMNK